jgi:hypothetical protein
VTAEPLGRDQAKAKLNRCLEDGRAIYSKHFREELAEDALDMEDVLAVCNSGAIRMAPEKDIRSGQWKYRIEGATSEHLHVAIVFTFKTDDAVFITIFEKAA